MAGPPNISARRLAVTVLGQCDPKHKYVATRLHEVLAQTGEKQRATDLVLGSLRNRIAIDTIISTYSGKPTRRIPRPVLNTLRVAVYELAYVPQTPAYSIVNEAVENIKQLSGRKQVGFVNAVLRKVSTRILSRCEPLAESPATRALPRTPQSACLFDSDILPDPATSPQQYLKTAFSLPAWLVHEWLDKCGYEAARDICFGSNRKPSIHLRPNVLRTDPNRLAEILKESDIQTHPASDAPILAVESPHDISDLPGFNDALFVVQDLAAWYPVAMLKPQAGWRVLDLCAAPGTKTTQLAEATNDAADIVATDIDAERLDRVRDNIARLDLQSIKLIAFSDLRDHAGKDGLFDAVLLDAPCSNTGVMAKRIEARYRLSPGLVTAMSQTQMNLLETAADLTKPAGTICYSTCSILSEENGDCVRTFLSTHSGWELVDEKLTFPDAAGFDHDGGYVAIIRKKT